MLNQTCDWKEHESDALKHASSGPGAQADDSSSNEMTPVRIFHASGAVQEHRLQELFMGISEDNSPCRRATISLEISAGQDAPDEEQVKMGLRCLHV